MNRRRMIQAGLAALAANTVRPNGASAQSLADITKNLQTFVDAGQIAGAVTLVQRHGEVIALNAVGYRDLATRAPMRTDTIFQIMSQSKPYIAASVMMLQDEGRLNVEDPVDRYLPEFADVWLLESGDAARRSLVRPARKITIADVLSHSAGLMDAAPVTRSFPVKMRYSLAEVVDILSQQPLEAQPGARWRYSNQGIAVAARIVEVVSGQTYDRFVRSRIFEPLGMRDSTFIPPAAAWPRLAAAYEMLDGKIAELGPDTPGGGDQKYRRGARYILPEAGIYSTATEAARFHQLFLNRGAMRDRQFISQASVDLMLTPRIATPAQRGAAAGAQGLGWRLQPSGVQGPAALPGGSFHHSGAFGSFGWGDPAHGIVGVFLVQLPTAAAARDAFVTGVNRSLEI